MEGTGNTLNKNSAKWNVLIQLTHSCRPSLAHSLSMTGKMFTSVRKGYLWGWGLGPSLFFYVFYFSLFFIVFFVNPKRHKTRVLCSYYWVAHIIINHLHSLILIFLSLFSKQLVSLEYGQEMPYSPDYRCFINDTDHGFLRSHLHFTLDFQRQDSTLRCIIKGPLHFHITVRLR